MALGFGGIARAFESRNFRVFWVGNLTHTITVWVNRLAVGWLTWQLTESELWLGIIVAANVLPTVFLGVFAGVTADRFGHRNQLTVATYFGGVIALILAVLFYLDQLTMGLLVILTVASGTSRAFNVPARMAMLSTLVERKYLSAAIGINGSTFHGGAFLGPVIAGLIINNYGIGAAFVAYAAGEFIAATTFIMLSLDRVSAREKGKFRVFEDLAAGLRYTAGHQAIRTLLILSVITAVFIQPYFDMLPGFAADVFGFGDDSIGLTYLASSSGAGAMVGGLWLARRGRMDGLVRIQITTLGLGIIAMIAFAATDILLVSMGALVVVGFSLVAAQTCTSTLVQNAVDPELRARVVSLNGVINVGGPAMGAIVIGWVATKSGLQIPMAVSAIIALIILFTVARLVSRNASVLEAVDSETKNRSDSA